MKSEELKNQEYKYGFTTDIENKKAPKGKSIPKAMPSFVIYVKLKKLGIISID